MSTIFYAFGILLFVAVVLCVEGIYLWWNNAHGPAAKRIEARLRALSAGGHVGAEQLSILKKRLLADSPRLQQWLMRVPRIGALDRWLEQSGSTWSVAQLFGYCALVVLCTVALIPLLPLPASLVMLGAVLAAMLPVLHVVHLRAKRLKQLEAQLPDAVDMISRALRAGHSFSGALSMVGQEMKAPIGPEFRTTFEEINYGVALDEAMTNLAMRVPVADLRYFVIAVLIQRESGGNLAEILDTIGTMVRERLKLFDKIRVLSAEGKLSAWVLGLLPFGTAGMILVINPGFMNVLWEDPLGLRMIGGALVSMTFGVLWMRKIIRIRV
ncbi:type II secretion system F family protein [Cupriavidus taiwanensis]|uniref:Tad secretion system, secretion accessory protein n=2 Tax=Cupriavidus taiwanensis TaxID=164546 RepID=B3R2Y6_CUPTR|nr:type II secretion system F family protein [Cupriavidus taiwanensis]CAQ68667.1 Tad secretion system, secretion accessory protein [Cupriavidus taiwanensis LMG 19424]SOY55802.1 Tad secretion system, secretion accessory protein [Cupriavidus taiwanensis]SOY86421.1 Tad secretion system, secretion accessory protein [Cupriavidus taiwanensis]SOZ01643.1 Tad secretion system, secretion accessory protein [Cupriavidus taiwanensis]SOZ04682.1 Tad secretion system, secretion accessory protein [Cupriavidus 